MREIKFRGKSKNGNWYYGDLIRVLDGRIHYFIIQDYEVKDSEIKLDTCASPRILGTTLGRYTGLKDKNGVEIYEGDICLDNYSEEHGKIVFDEGKFVFIWGNVEEDLCNVFDTLEIVGNIHDNPELLEVQ